MGLPIVINERHLRPREFFAEARLQKARGGLGLVMLDYIQLVANERRYNDTKNDVVSEVSRLLKMLAHELNVPVVGLSQFSRDVEKQGREPRLSDLRDSGALEQDADTVIFLHRPKPVNHEDDSEPIEFIVAKQRNGKLGRTLLNYSKPNMKFTDFIPQM